MQILKSEMNEFATLVATAVIEALETKGLVGTPKANAKTEKTAYQKTEQLLYNYRGFKKIVEERLKEIETLKQCGIPKKSASIVEYSPKSGTVHGITLEEESVESAIAEIERSISGTVRAIELIDKCMKEINTDPYYEILPLTYFEGRTQDDIADKIGCSQVSISKNKNRLVKELALRLFPTQVMNEMLS